MKKLVSLLCFISAPAFAEVEIPESGVLMPGPQEPPSRVVNDLIKLSPTNFHGELIDYGNMSLAWGGFLLQLGLSLWP